MYMNCIDLRKITYRFMSRYPQKIQKKSTKFVDIIHSQYFLKSGYLDFSHLGKFIYSGERSRAILDPLVKDGLFTY